MADTAEKEREDLESDRQLELIEHLTELRTRIIRIAVYVTLGTLAGWIFYNFFTITTTLPGTSISSRPKAKVQIPSAALISLMPHSGESEPYTMGVVLNQLLHFAAFPLIVGRGRWRILGRSDKGCRTYSLPALPAVVRQFA